MNKFILCLLVIPILLVGICAVSASQDSGAEIPDVEHTADSHYSLGTRFPPFFPPKPIPIPPFMEIPDIDNEAPAIPIEDGGLSSDI